MAWQGFHPACRKQTSKAEILPGFICAYALAWGTNGRDGSSYLMKVFFRQTVHFWLFGTYNRVRGLRKLRMKLTIVIMAAALVTVICLSGAAALGLFDADEHTIQHLVYTDDYPILLADELATILGDYSVGERVERHVDGKACSCGYHQDTIDLSETGQGHPLGRPGGGELIEVSASLEVIEDKQKSPQPRAFL